MSSGVSERLVSTIARSRLALPVREARLARTFGVRNYVTGSRTLHVELGGSKATFKQRPLDLKEVKRPIEGTLRKEREPLLDLIRRVEPGDVFYDVGANLGIFTCLVPAKTVVAFEPIAENVVRLAENMALNDVPGHIVQVALTDEADLVEFHRYDFDVVDLEYAVREPGDERGSFSRYIPTATGDDVIETTELPSPDVLKIDVQGGEYEVLSGLSASIDDHPPRSISCEIHPGKLEAIDQSEDDVLDFLDERGYTWETLREGTETYSIIATR